MGEIGYVRFGDLVLRDDPARDACFTVVRSDADMYDYPPDDPRAIREMVHRHMANEMTSLDIAAACLVEFPDAPWELRMELARQCWDETRHVQVLYRRLQELGGRKGEFPITTFEWNVTCALDNLPGRLASQNRSLEAGAMDVVGGLVAAVRERGDEQTARVLEGILADEVHHVRFANRWIKSYAERQPRTLMDVAVAVRFLARANALAQSPAGEVNAAGKVLEGTEDRIPAVNVEDRRLAEFSEEEIGEILRQAGFRSLAKAAPPRP